MLARQDDHPPPAHVGQAAASLQRLLPRQSLAGRIRDDQDQEHVPDLFLREQIVPEQRPAKWARFRSCSAT